MLASIFTLLGLVAPAVAVADINGNAFVGCVLQAGLPSSNTPVFGATTQALCDTACINQNFLFNYFSPGNQNCYCSSAPPAAAGLQTTATSLGACASATHYNAQKLQTTYIFQECANQITYWDGPDTTAVADVWECMQYCSANYNKVTWLFAIYYPAGQPGGTYKGPWCQCSASTGYVRVPCTASTAYNYNLDKGQFPSWVVKRAQANMDDDAQRQSLGLCPSSFDACRVGPGADGYECLDTTTELEACGGCRYGSISTNATASETTGVDCTTLEGVSRSGASCEDGKCRAYSCLRGWKLVGNNCVQERKFARAG